MTALFDVPDPEPPAMSKVNEDRATGGKARYSPIHRKEPPACDECVAVQHETRGESGHRRTAKVQRTVSGRTPLLLCSAHAEEWKQRDG